MSPATTPDLESGGKTTDPQVDTRAQVDHDQAPSWLAHAIARPSGLAGRETTVLEEVRQGAGQGRHCRLCQRVSLGRLIHRLPMTVGLVALPNDGLTLAHDFNFARGAA